MRCLLRSVTALCAGGLLAVLPTARPQAMNRRNPAETTVVASPAKAAKVGAKADQSPRKKESEVPEINLLKAARDGLVTVTAEGTGDGRMTVR